MEYMRKIRHMEMREMLKGNISYGGSSIRKGSRISQRSVMERKRVELQARLRGVHQDSMNKIEEMENF